VSAAPSCTAASGDTAPPGNKFPTPPPSLPSRLGISASPTRGTSAATKSSVAGDVWPGPQWEASTACKRASVSWASASKRRRILELRARESLQPTLLFYVRSGQNLGLSGGDPPNPPCGRRGCTGC
jgi:hypothetical protein